LSVEVDFVGHPDLWETWSATCTSDYGAQESGGEPESSPASEEAASSVGTLAVAQRLLNGGWTMLGVSDQPELSGERFRWIEADLLQLAAVAHISQTASRLNAIICAAGVQHTAPLRALDHGFGRQMWQLHVDGPARLVDALVTRLVDGGRIVVIGSRTSSGAAGKSQYAATKAAVFALTRSWAMELAPRRITVNVVAPGPTETAMLEDPARVSTPTRVPPLGRYVQPEEVAGLVALLLGPDGASITGQQLVICGGASL
jgi:NAD(P)-dependent dehydrogenase (short-subunit alcohol dehydrogenase family)